MVSRPAGEAIDRYELPATPTPLEPCTGGTGPPDARAPAGASPAHTDVTTHSTSSPSSWRTLLSPRIRFGSPGRSQAPSAARPRFRAAPRRSCVNSVRFVARRIHSRLVPDFPGAAYRPPGSKEVSPGPLAGWLTCFLRDASFSARMATTPLLSDVPCAHRRLARLQRRRSLPIHARGDNLTESGDPGTSRCQRYIVRRACSSAGCLAHSRAQSGKSSATTTSRSSPSASTVVAHATADAVYRLIEGAVAAELRPYATLLTARSGGLTHSPATNENRWSGIHSHFVDYGTSRFLSGAGIDVASVRRHNRHIRRT
jgi:hypothetical protein